MISSTDDLDDDAPLVSEASSPDGDTFFEPSVLPSPSVSKPPSPNTGESKVNKHYV